ncbi:MFS transporter [Microbispora sp. NPDC049633]|uniref:MFS transporter n=1 Tax=Microbispora sp. NPDC049633 TaxID=3154355 RepID=UPI00341BF0F2
MSSRAGEGARARTPHPARLIVLATSAAVIASVMSTSMLNLAQPDLVRAFGVGYESLQWRHVVFWTALGVGMPTLGRLCRSVRPRTLILTGLALFLVSAVGSATTRTFGLWLGWQALQGLADAFIVPAQSVIIRQVLPEERRGWAFGIMASVIAAANVVGPGIGGLILQFGAWPMIFWFMCVVGILAAIASLVLIPASPPEGGGTVRLPLAAAVLFAVMVVAVQALLMPGEWASGRGYAWLPVLAVAAACFRLLESRAADDRRFAPRSLFLHRDFLVAMARGFVVFTAVNAVFFFLPSHLRESGQLPAGLAGALLLASAIIRVSLGGWGGRRSDADLSKSLSVGVVLVIAAILLFLPGGPGTMLYLAVPALVLSSVGSVLLTPGLNKLGMRAMPEGDTGTFAGFFQLAQFLPGGLAGAAFGRLVEDGRTGGFDTAGYRWVLVISALLLLVALLLARRAERRPDQRPAGALAARPMAVQEVE